MPTIINFGRNLRFSPQRYYEPRTESELLDVLQTHGSDQIRCVGSKHCWNEGIKSTDVLIGLRHLNQIQVLQGESGPIVRVGGGCQVKRLIATLNRHGLTLPSIGLISEQTVAGATATGTHGSGKHSLSHYIQAARIARIHDHKSEIVNVSSGDALRAARCSLGAMGIVVSLDLPCIAQYNVEERVRVCELEDILASIESEPLLQFFLLPHAWDFCSQERKQVDRNRSLTATLYRAYWWLGLDIGMHLLILACASWLRSRSMVRWLFRSVISSLTISNWRVVDRSDRMLTMDHERFHHLELEAFVREPYLRDAAAFVEVVLKQADSADVTLDDDFRNKLADAGLLTQFHELRGVHTHHYPVCFRRILQDDTLISMASKSPRAPNATEDWFSISFITYAYPRAPFYELATFLAKSMVALFDGRIHWGKWFPLDTREIEQMYGPQLETFRGICEEFDPDGVFQNTFSARVLAKT